MSNRDTEAARAYHEATKLSYINLNNKPPLYKRYTGLPVVPLPEDDLGSTVPRARCLDLSLGGCRIVPGSGGAGQDFVPVRGVNPEGGPTGGWRGALPGGRIRGSPLSG